MSDDTGRSAWLRQVTPIGQRGYVAADLGEHRGVMQSDDTDWSVWLRQVTPTGQRGYVGANIGGYAVR